MALKAAGLSGIPTHVIVSTSIFGIALLYSALAMWRGSWPPIDRETVKFYALSGAFGFILPFILETLVAPNMSVFVFVMIIATMPVFTVLMAAVFGSEKPGTQQYIAVGLGFIVAVLIVYDASGGAAAQQIDWKWILLAFGVPVFYAGNTLYVASHFPRGVQAIQIAHAQALIVSVAAFLGSVLIGVTDEWHLISRNVPAIAGIVFEGLALLIYLKITRDFGATFVSLANYVSMVFAVILGAIFFDDNLTWLSLAATGFLIASLSVIQLKRV